VDSRAWGDRWPTLRVIPRLHVVTDDEILARPDFETHARDVCEASAVGVERGHQTGEGRMIGSSVAFHLRGPRTPGRRLTQLARTLHEPATTWGVRLLLNDRLDVALAVGAAGVHLGAGSMPPDQARSLLGPRRLLGVSVHSPTEAVRAAASRVDYLFVGTLFETASHPGVSVGGARLMSSVASRVDIPLVGIGGITPQRTTQVVAAGGYGVAAIRGIWDAPSPPDAVRAYLDALERMI
jgi:thiamine-phosphate diphosphorylase